MHGQFERANIEARHLIDGNQVPAVVAAIIKEQFDRRAAMIEP